MFAKVITVSDISYFNLILNLICSVYYGYCYYN